jgi:hypothetical protein
MYRFIQSVLPEGYGGLKKAQQHQWKNNKSFLKQRSKASRPLDFSLKKQNKRIKINQDYLVTRLK